MLREVGRSLVRLGAVEFVGQPQDLVAVDVFALGVGGRGEGAHVQIGAEADAVADGGEHAGRVAGHLVLAGFAHVPGQAVPEGSGRRLVRSRDRRWSHDPRVGRDGETGVLEFAGGPGHGPCRRVVGRVVRQQVDVEVLAVAEVVLAQDLVEERSVIRDGGGHPVVGVHPEGDVRFELQSHRVGSLVGAV